MVTADRFSKDSPKPESLNTDSNLSGSIKNVNELMSSSYL